MRFHEQEHDRWLSCFERRPSASQRLVCFAHAGGSASTYAGFHRELPGDIEVFAVQLPGRDERRSEPYQRHFGKVASAIVGALESLRDKPLSLFGYSVGALLAFECARALRARDPDLVRHLFVAARKAPQIPFDPPLAALSDARFIDEMKRRYDGIPNVILEDEELLAYFLPTMRADVSVLESYVYGQQAPLSCPITVFGGNTDPHANRADLESWSQHTAARLEVKMFAGGHFFIAQSRRAVLEVIAHSLL
jgi:medium-chain acyl-[acyl-carrier-protein] hydrolase